MNTHDAFAPTEAALLPGSRLGGIAGVFLHSVSDSTAANTRTEYPVDIVFDGARVSAVIPHDPSRADSSWLDLRGYTVFPAAVEPHAHLDKALSWDLINPPAGDLDRAIESWVSASATFTEDEIFTRARRAALMLLTSGTTALRTHVDVYPSVGRGNDPYRGIRALARLRSELTGLMTLQLVALVPAHTPADQLLSLTEGALESGADLVGGAPHLAPNPIAQIDTLLSIAESKEVGCDLHIDEFLEPSAATVDCLPNAHQTQTVHHYAARVAGWPSDRIRGAGHCCRLSQMNAADLAETATELRRAGIHVIGLPATNLYLQGDEPQQAPRQRGIAPLSELRNHGVHVCAGGDNIRDPFNPTGRADPLETAALLVTAAHQSPEEALRLITDDARRALGLPPAGPVPGAVADLLCVRMPTEPVGITPTTAHPAATQPTAMSVVSLIAAAPPERTVISGGCLASQTTTTVSVPTLPHLGALC